MIGSFTIKNGYMSGGTEIEEKLYGYKKGYVNETINKLEDFGSLSESTLVDLRAMIFFRGSGGNSGGSGELLVEYVSLYSDDLSIYKEITVKITVIPVDYVATISFEPNEMKSRVKGELSLTVATSDIDVKVEIISAKMSKLPEIGPLSLLMANIILGKEPTSQISLNDNNVRNLAKKSNGTISIEDLKGKRYNGLEYYFETYEDAKNSIASILSKHKNDLSEVTIKFHPNVTDIQNLFNGTDIVKTPKYITGINITNVSYIFYGCKYLEEISESLFATSPNLRFFVGSFSNCTSLHVIPRKLFYTCSKALSFNHTFSRLSSINPITIPPKLFSNCPLAYDFSGTFKNSYIQVIPSDLFEYAFSAENFEETFRDVGGLMSVSPRLFDRNSKVVNFRRTFYNCGFIQIGGIPDAWNKSKHPDVVYYDEYAGGGTEAPNIDEVPSGWK